MPRVLIIDDQKDVRAMVAIVLRVNHYEVAEADGGAAGLKSFAEGRFDAVIVDIFLGDFVLETAGPGALLGEMALIDDSPRTANAVAKTPSKLAQIDRRRFHFLVQQTPHFATHVMKILANRLRHMNAVTAVR